MDGVRLGVRDQIGMPEDVHLQHPLVLLDGHMGEERLAIVVENPEIAATEPYFCRLDFTGTDASFDMLPQCCGPQPVFLALADRNEVGARGVDDRGVALLPREA